jgi:glycosyltransferase involved in cell wall biosynthesis
MAEPRRPTRPTVSVVFITYNRPDLCRGAVQAFREHCPGANRELIITDDGSASEIVEELRCRNTNRGLRAANGSYILHHQDDWRCRSSEPFIAWSIEILKRHPEVGLVKLQHEVSYRPPADLRLADGTPYSILDFDAPPSGIGIYMYSDHPHLKRADFHAKAGYFAEGLCVGVTEDAFCHRFLALRPYQVATLWRSDLFENVGLDRSTRPQEQRSRARSMLYLRVMRAWWRLRARGLCLVATKN